MALFETLTDNFNDNSINIAKWTPDSYYGGSYSETSQQVRLNTINPAPDIVSGANFLSTNTYDLTSSYVKLQLISKNTPVSTLFFAVYDATRQAHFEIQGNALYAQWYVHPNNTNVASGTYNSTTHKWFRIREQSGTIYYETSSNGYSWTVFGSIIHGITFTNFQTFFEIRQNKGVSGIGEAIFDNFNIEYYTPQITLTGDATVVPDFQINFYPEITITGDSSIEAIGVSLADQRQIEKSYLYKVYDSSGNYLGLWDDVISDLNFDQELYSAGSSIQVDLARNSDSRITELEDILIHNGETLLTQDSNTLVAGAESRNAVGPGSNVDVNYRLAVWVFYGEITELATSLGEIITTQDDEPIQVNYGAVNGLRKFYGKIRRYVSRYGGNETVQVSIDSMGIELDNYVLESGSNTTVTYNSYDPSNIVKDALDKFTAAGGTVDYDVSSVALTGTVVSYTFRLNTYLEVVKKSIELAPYDWYWYVGLGDNILYFQDEPTTVAHTFILGKHINELNLEYSIENITNVVYFTGGDTGGGSNLFKKYTDATSITAYGQGLQRIVDHRVTIAANATLISEAEIDRNSVPRYRTSVTILDNVYDIEDIRLGQLVTFRNFDNYIDGLELQIVGLRYEPDKVTLQLDTLLPSVNKRIEDLRRNMVELDNIETPAAPS